jgi:hypothetical protein
MLVDSQWTTWLFIAIPEETSNPARVLRFNLETTVYI